MPNFIVRTITGVLFVAAVVASLLDPTAMLLLFGLVTAMTVWELTGLVNRRKNVEANRFICTVAGVYLFFAVWGFSAGVTPSSVFIPYLITLVYLLIAELYAKNEDPISTWAYTMLSQMYVALPLSMLSVLAFRPVGDTSMSVYSPAVPLCLFIFLWLNDTGAYCTGSLIGRHKLFPRISPGKTWEGSTGGAVLVTAAAIVISIYGESWGLDDTGLTMPQWIGLGLVVVVFGTWGDLVESLFKRTLDIKDSGNILPGHGGMLDRFDSSLLAIPAAVVYLYSITLF